MCERVAKQIAIPHTDLLSLAKRIEDGKSIDSKRWIPIFSQPTAARPATEQKLLVLLIRDTLEIAMHVEGDARADDGTSAADEREQRKKRRKRQGYMGARSRGVQL